MPTSGDNIQLNPGSGGDISRALDRNVNGIKTQIAALDLGGPLGSPENLVLGPQLMALVPQFLMALVKALNSQQAAEVNGGRIRVVLDAGPGAQTLGTVTNVTTVAGVTTITVLSTLAALGPSGAGIPIRDAQITPMEREQWANTVRRLIP